MGSARDRVQAAFEAAHAHPLVTHALGVLQPDGDGGFEAPPRMTDVLARALSDLSSDGLLTAVIGLAELAAFLKREANAEPAVAAILAAIDGQGPRLEQLYQTWGVDAAVRDQLERAVRPTSDPGGSFQARRPPQVGECASGPAGQAALLAFKS